MSAFRIFPLFFLWLDGFFSVFLESFFSLLVAGPCSIFRFFYVCFDGFKGLCVPCWPASFFMFRFEQSPGVPFPCFVSLIPFSLATFSSNFMLLSLISSPPFSFQRTLPPALRRSPLVFVARYIAFLFAFPLSPFFP